MKVLYDNAEYPCKAAFINDCARILFKENRPDDMTGTIAIIADTGFILRSLNTGDYLRSYWDENTFVLTNAPEPVYVEPSEPAEPAEERDWDDVAAAILEGVNDV